jgi:hypothetical protein
MVLSLGYFRGITMRLYLIAGLACLAATPALAQSQYTRQVNTQLDAMESNARNNGQTRLFRSPIFQLNEGQTQTYPISLVRGRAYTIGGVCDVDCPDLDIKLIDPNGREVATDVLTDSVPLVSHTATMSGDYRVRVIMYDCNQRELANMINKSPISWMTLNVASRGQHACSVRQSSDSMKAQRKIIPSR